MIGEIKTTTVQGKVYKVWSDFKMRATYSENEAGEVKMLAGGTYLSNDLTIRKAIATVYGLETFRK